MAMSKRDQKAMEQQGALITSLRLDVERLQAELTKCRVMCGNEVNRILKLRTEAGAAHESLRSLNTMLSQMSNEARETTVKVAMEGMAQRAWVIRSSLGDAIQASYQSEQALNRA